MSDDKKVISFEEQKQRLREELESGISNISKDDYVDDAKLKEMNEKHAFINSIGGKPMILSYVYNAVFDKKVIEFRAPESIERQYSNQSIQVGQNHVELGKWWIKNADRREYDTVIFDPSQPTETKGCLNLYEGLSVVPTKGIWKRTLAHVYRILCNSERDKFIYTIKWLAWCLQNPGRRAEVVIIFKGKQGAGKGFIFSQFVKIFGTHGIHISNRSHLTGEFNGHFQTCVFMFADEAYYPGDKEVEGALNQIISEEKIAIRAMRRDVVISKNCLHIGMSTNAEWVIPASGDARRYYINEVYNKYAKNQIDDKEREKYFDALWGEMENGGREAMVYDLLNMDLGTFHPRFNVPETQEYKKQSSMGIPKEDKAIKHFLDNGEFPGELTNKGEFICSSKGFASMFYKLHPSYNKLSDPKIKENLKNLGVAKIRRTNGIFWEFPSLKQMKLNFTRKYSFIEFEDLEDDWSVIGSEY